MHRATAVWGVALLVSAALLRAQSTSTAQNPAYTFSTFGPHQVTLQVCNPGGCDTITKTVNVLDPRPAVTSASLAVAIAEVGQPVWLTGAGTGQPPLTYNWTLLLGGTLVQQVSGASGWLPTFGLAPGLYAAVLRITNASGLADSLPQVLVVTEPAAVDFYTVTPCRLLDTRTGSPLVSGTAKIVTATGACGIPADARAVVTNITVIGPTAAGSLTAYPGNLPAPNASEVSFRADVIRASSAVLPLASDGTGTLALLASLTGGGTVHLVIDVSGYFAL